MSNLSKVINGLKVDLAASARRLFGSGSSREKRQTEGGSIRNYYVPGRRSLDLTGRNSTRVRSTSSNAGVTLQWIP